MSFSVMPNAARMIRASTSVPEPGSSSETRLPLRSATLRMPAPLRATTWMRLRIEVADQAQVGDLGLALVDAGAGVRPVGDVRLREARLHLAGGDAVDVGDRSVRRDGGRDQARHAAAAALVAGARARRVGNGVGDQAADRVVGAGGAAGADAEELDVLRDAVTAIAASAVAANARASTRARESIDDMVNLGVGCGKKPRKCRTGRAGNSSAALAGTSASRDSVVLE